MNAMRNYFALFLSLTLTLVVAYRVSAAGQATAKPPSVVMVCEHGAVKSVIATLLFDQEANKRGLPFRAISRGITLYDQVPDKISQALQKDGFDVSEFKPQGLSNEDVASSSRVVAIGTDLSAFQDGTASTIQQWDDIPPASVDYKASRAALLAHIRTLLDDLEEEASEQ